MRIRFALLCFVILAAPIVVCAQDEEAAPLPLRILDAVTAAPIASVEISAPSGALLTLGDAYGFASIPAHATDSAFLIVRATGFDADTLFPPFGEEVLLRPTGSRVLEEVVVRPDAAAPVIPSRRDAVIDYTFVGDYLLVATTRGPRKNALILLGPRGDTVAHTTLREEPEGLYTACDGTPYALFFSLNRFQPVSSVESQLQLGKRYPIRMLPGVEACQLMLNDALFYRSFSAEDFSFRLWRWAATDTAPKIFAERIDTAAAIASMEEDWRAPNGKYGVSWHAGYSLQGEALRLLRNRNVYRELNSNLMLLHDTLLLPDLRTRRIVHFNSEGKELMAPPLRFSWGSLVQFSLLQDAATGRIYLHRYARTHAQTIQEIDPRTGALRGREVSIQKAFPQKVKVRGGRIYYLWQDDRAGGAQQLFTQALPAGH